MNENNVNQKFPGFPADSKANYWKYPRIMNGWWQSLNGSEQKVLDYILRRTWGFDKPEDDISLSQIRNGLNERDKGTGLSKPAIISALNKLVEKGFIRKSDGKWANHYVLVKNFNYPSKESLPFDSKKSLPTIENNTIKEEQYSSSSKKQILESYKKGERNFKPYFRKEEMRLSRGRWWVIPKDNGKWLEFVGNEMDIELVPYRFKRHKK